MTWSHVHHCRAQWPGRCLHLFANALHFVVSLDLLKTPEKIPSDTKKTKWSPKKGQVSRCPSSHHYQPQWLRRPNLSRKRRRLFLWRRRWFCKTTCFWFWEPLGSKDIPIYQAGQLRSLQWADIFARSPSSFWDSSGSLRPFLRVLFVVVPSTPTQKSSTQTKKNN